MRNIFLFIRRFFTFFLFLVLLGISFAVLIKYNQTYQAAFANTAGDLTGRLDKQYNDFQYYFHLKETNKQLVDQNARLLNLLGTAFDAPDSIKNYKIDSLIKDTLGRVRKFATLPAKVVNNSVSEEYNFLTLFRGANQGVKKDMPVIGPDGVVGRVISVSNNYCRVMSLLNRNSKVYAMLKKGMVSGAVEWDGEDPQYLVMRKVNRSAIVQKGDSVITSNINGLSYPPGVLIGTVAQVKQDVAGGSFILKVKTATNFYNLEYAYLVENMMWQEQKTLEDQTPKPNE
jgi:rod shape-determining protein MreC